MSQLNLSNPALSGTAEAYAAANAGGDSFPMPGRLIVKIKNASGAGRTVTFAGQKPCSQGALHNAAVSVPAGSTVDVTLADANRFADSGGRVQMTYDSEVGLSFLAYAG